MSCERCPEESVALYAMDGKDMDGNNIHVVIKLCAKHRREVARENEAAQTRGRT